MCILSKYVMCIYCYQTWVKPSSDIQLMTSKATTSYRLIYQCMIVYLMSMQYSTYICLANYLDNSHSPEKLLKHLAMFVLPTDWYFLHHGHIDILGCYPDYPFFGGYYGTPIVIFFKSFSYMYGTTWTSLLIWCGLACYFMILCPWLLFKTLSADVSTSINHSTPTHPSALGTYQACSLPPRRWKCPGHGSWHMKFPRWEAVCACCQQFEDTSMFHTTVDGSIPVPVSIGSFFNYLSTCN